MALGDRFLRKATPDDDAKSVKELIPSGKKSALLKRLEDEYDIQINTHSTDLANYRGTILEAPPEALHIFAPMAAALPSLAANVQSQGILTRQLYTVTSKGSDVMPNQLWQKKNGALLTNSRQPNSGAFGNQNDLKPLDPKELKAAQAANVASMVFIIFMRSTTSSILFKKV